MFEFPSQDSEMNFQQQLLDFTRFAANRERKPYSNLLIDRPLKANLTTKQSSFNHLLNCLRYRLNLAPKKIQRNSREDPPWQPILRQLSLQDSPSAVHRGQSLYDTLLQLIDEFDAAGAAEIFRFLLERRIAIPLFVPESKKHYVQLLKHITLPDGTLLGEDKSMMRIAVFSCRNRYESQTCEILKNIFHIESFHRYDFQTNCITSEILSAEIGFGCVKMEGDKFQPFLVAHVMGNFCPLWPFLHRFADYLLIEDAADDESGDCSLLINGRYEEILDDISIDNAKLLSLSCQFPYVCIWKPTSGEAKGELKNDGFRHFLIEGQLEKTYEVIRSAVADMDLWKSLARRPPSERFCLDDMSILEDAGYTELQLIPSVDISPMLKKNQKLEDVKKNELVLQKNCREQAKHEEKKLECQLDKDKMRNEDYTINYFRELSRVQAPKVQDHLLLRLLLKLLADGSSCSRILSIRLLDKELVQRSENELRPVLIKIRQLNSELVKQSANSRNGNDWEKQKLDAMRMKLNEAREEFNEKVVGVEHLWRELILLFTYVAPEKQTFYVKKLPHFAAQHLLDGFSIQLLDGVSNT